MENNLPLTMVSRNMKEITVIIFFSLFCQLYSCFAQKENLIDSLKLNFVEIPSGKFIMGSTYHAFQTDSINEKWYRDEAPVHRVSITRKFELSTHEITRKQFEYFILATSYITDAEKSSLGSLGKYNDQKGIWEVDSTINWKNPGYDPTSNNPITHVSWKDAKAFCNWLNSIDLIYYYALPTEAEWEYAAGNANQNIYSWGNDLPNDKNGGNIADKSFAIKFPNWKYPVYSQYNDNFPLLSPVGVFSPNKFGLYDMTGNVWEWVDDYYSSYSIKPQINPTNTSGELYGEIPLIQHKYNEIKHNNNELIREKVVRGGGFDWELPYLRVTKRRKVPVDSRYLSEYFGLPYLSAINIGFRIKRTMKESIKEDDFVRDVLQKQMNKFHFKNIPFEQISWDYYHSIMRVKISQILRIPNTNFYYVFVNGLGGDDYPFGQLYFVEMPSNPYGVIGYTLLKQGFYLDLKLELSSNLNSIRAFGVEANSPYGTKEFDEVFNPTNNQFWIVFK